MKLIGKDFDGEALLRKLEGRLRARGLVPADLPAPDEVPVAPRVDPITFNLEMLEEHADASRALPLETHRAGFGRAVLVAKWAFRKSCQIFLNEAFARQRLFNGHVRDSYAQLSAEVVRLRREVETLRAAQAEETQSAREPTNEGAPQAEPATRPKAATTSARRVRRKPKS